MDLKTYEKTRYQNIYRHKKNKNYVVQMSKPVKTTISRIEGEKIFKLDEALKIRDNPKIKLSKAKETLNKDSFESLWDKYMNWCIITDKQAYTNYNKKRKVYNKYFKNKFKKAITKIGREDIEHLINKMDCSDKQKNENLRILKAFFYWCMNEEEIIVIHPMKKIKYYKTEKPKMKFWTPEEITKFMECINTAIQSESLKEKETAYRTKIIVMLGFSLGDRVGETRALKFSDIDEIRNIITIRHSINYDPNSKDFISHTKTYGSQREIDVSPKLIEEINKYKLFLINECGYNINNDSMIFINQETHKPFTDVSLRKVFYRYCEKAGVSKIRMYDLRHTYVATMMSEGKELYLISEKLGHTSYNTTVNKYGHLSNETRKEIARLTDKYI